MQKPRLPAPRTILAFVIVVLIACALTVFVIAGHNPYLVQESVDWVRGIVGPGPVAAIENAFYQAADVYNQVHYNVTGDSTSWQLASTDPTLTSQASTAGSGSAARSTVGLESRAAANGERGAMRGALALAPEGTLTAGVSAPISGSLATITPAVSEDAGQNGSQTDGMWYQLEGPSTTIIGGPASGPAAPAEELRPLLPLIRDGKLPGEGVWQPLISSGQPAFNPVLWQTIYRPDPQRPFARVALVAMDLTRSQLHIVVGTQEPASSQPALGLRTGMIPIDVQAGGTLIAAWNGGFKAVHSHYGMMTDGVTWLDPIDEMGTVAVARDGQVEMGAWGQEISPTGDWLAWRQNNPPLIVKGAVNPEVTKTADTIRWGASLDRQVVIWRSGMGITRGHHWLIYAAGNSLSAATLTEALRAADCYAAMQLDVNMTWEQYMTYTAKPQATKLNGQPFTVPLTGHKLIDQMFAAPTMYLVPYSRDFFYLTYLPAH